MARIDQLNTELTGQVKRFVDESEKHKSLYRILRYWLFGLTALSTILAGLALRAPTPARDAASLAVIVVNALAALVTSVEGLRKPADLWIHERNISYALKDLQREINYRCAGTITDKDIDDFFARMQTILSASLEKWVGAIQPHRPPQPPEEHSPTRDNTKSKL